MLIAMRLASGLIPGVVAAALTVPRPTVPGFWPKCAGSLKPNERAALAVTGVHQIAVDVAVGVRVGQGALN
jgi:hypothetical protein